MTIQQAIKSLAAQTGQTMQAIGARLGLTSGNMSRLTNKPDHRIKSDLLPIASALGCSLRLQFVRADGSIAAEVDYVQEQETEAEQGKP